MRLLFSILILLSLSACQSFTVETETVQNNNELRTDGNSWSALYLHYKAMNVTELEQAITELQSAPVSKESTIRQVLIYLVPHSPVKNVHMGRTLLRRWLTAYPEEASGEWQLLLDTLTETTRLSERLQRNTVTHKSLLQQLEQGKIQLQQQIEQLKSIEQHINDRDNRNNGK